MKFERCFSIIYKKSAYSVKDNDNATEGGNENE